MSTIFKYLNLRKNFVMYLVLFASLFCCRVGLADDDQLEKLAKAVPIEAVDRDVLNLIHKELDQKYELVKSHYTLALFEDLASKEKWYILDGYFEIQDDKILFLDFSYDPYSKTWWPINNYKNLIPQKSNRYMLMSREICNLNRRHYIGVLEGTLKNFQALEKIMAYFENGFQATPLFILDQNQLLIASNSAVNFNLKEAQVINHLKLAANTEFKLVSLERATSDDDIKKTYAAVTRSCEF